MASIPRLRATIVLAHGLLGFSRIRLFGLTLASYFNRIPELLEAAGNTVIQPEVPPVGSIGERAAALAKAIRKNVSEDDEFGGRLHIIAHSMGGLDSRHMITHLGMADRVLSLTTLGTPHRGTVFADRGVAFGERSGALNALRGLGIPDDAFQDLTTDRCQAFNLVTPNADGVRYFSVAGNRARREMLALLQPSHDIVAATEGPNDGLVSVESARWGESCEIWNSDHVNLVGWVSPWERMAGRAFDVEAGYAGVLERLVEVESAR